MTFVKAEDAWLTTDVNGVAFCAQALYGDRVRVLRTAESRIEIELPGVASGWIDIGAVTELTDQCAPSLTNCVPISIAYRKPDLLTPSFRIGLGARIAIVERRWVKSPNDVDIEMGKDALGNWFTMSHFSSSPARDYSTIVNRMIGFPYLHLGRGYKGVDDVGLIDCISRCFVSNPYSQSTSQHDRVFSPYDQSVQSVALSIFRRGDQKGILVDGQKMVYASADSMLVVQDIIDRLASSEKRDVYTSPLESV